MSHRRRNKPVEQLRTTWTSTEDLEETLQEMFGRKLDDSTTTSLPQAPDEANFPAPPATATSSPEFLETSPPEVLISSPGEATAPPEVIVSSPHEDSAALMYRTQDGCLVPARAVHRATLAQHGHSSSEHQVYQILWSAGDAKDDEAVYRDVQVGQTYLVKQTGISGRSMIGLLRRLQEKLSIEVLAAQISASSTSKVYRVYSVDQILERRRRAGLEWVVRNKGVQFVFPAGIVISLPPEDFETSPPDVTLATENLHHPKFL